MGPEVSTNITSMMRAMQNVVLPAIDAENGLAREQGFLVLLYLQLLQDQHRGILHFRQQEIAEYSDLILAMLERVQVDAPLAADARALVGDSAPLREVSLPHYEDFARTARALREAADRIVADAMAGQGSGSDTAVALRTLLVDQAGREAMRERSWVAATGLDPRAEELLPIDTLLRDPKTGLG